MFVDSGTELYAWLEKMNRGGKLQRVRIPTPPKLSADALVGEADPIRIYPEYEEYELIIFEGHHIWRNVR